VPPTGSCVSSACIKIKPPIRTARAIAALRSDIGLPNLPGRLAAVISASNSLSVRLVQRVGILFSLLMLIGLFDSGQFTVFIREKLKGVGNKKGKR
jgi:hypothetical protein